MVAIKSTILQSNYSASLFLSGMGTLTVSISYKVLGSLAWSFTKTGKATTMLSSESGPNVASFHVIIFSYVFNG